MMFVNTAESRDALRRMADHLDNPIYGNGLFDVDTSHGFIHVTRLAENAEFVLGPDCLDLVSFPMSPKAGQA